MFPKIMLAGVVAGTLAGCAALDDAQTYVKDLFSGAPATQLTADQAAFAAQVATYDAQFKTTAGQVGASVLAVAKSACGYVSEANGLFVVVAGVADPSLLAVEAAVYGGAEAACSVVDAFDPTQTLTANVEAAAAKAIAAVPQIKDALAALSPTAAVAATAPVAPATP